MTASNPRLTNWNADPRTAEELFSASLQGDYDDEAAWDAVSILRLRSTQEIFELAKRNSESRDPKARARALDVLAQLGAGKPDYQGFLKESIEIALKATEDCDPDVIHSAAWALAHLGSDRAQAKLLALKKHPDSGVRHAVAYGLHGAAEPEAIEAVIELMEDQDDTVRDWATFALGSSLPPQDSPAIRAALRKRLDDSYEDARDEAVWGLAVRRDRDGLQLLLRRLESEEHKGGDLDAAAEVLNVESGTPVKQLSAGIRELLANI